MTGKHSGVVKWIVERAPSEMFNHCFLHREALAAKDMVPELHTTLHNVIKCVNYIKKSSRLSRCFQAFCRDMESEHQQVFPGLLQGYEERAPAGVSRPSAGIWRASTSRCFQAFCRDMESEHQQVFPGLLQGYGERAPAGVSRPSAGIWRASTSRCFQAFCRDMESEHQQVLYHAGVRWRSRGKLLSRFYELRTFPL
ncbi:SCAN domain-containing protein 3-like isoform X2 [Oncorhynchus keta]|uniref:SCAN domain-containing protein 3-like isoform X2 n=1 Tax=Oncorhynchus keta TaxID=8018 RepID=UPI00227C8C1B|nr:SCAN domain-containing protein 3-like isoform X2 [Oncorhynchus keta]